MTGTTRTPLSLVERLTNYSGAGSAPEFKMPEDLSTLSDAELTELHTKAIAEFDSTYGDGVGHSAATLTLLGTLTEAIESLSGAIEERVQLAAQNDAAAAALASRVKGSTLSTDEGTQTDSVADIEEVVTALGGEIITDGAAADGESIVASGRDGKKLQIRIPQGRNRQEVANAARLAVGQKRDMRQVAFAKGEGLGVAAGTGVNFAELGKALDHKLSQFNLTQYQNAGKMGRQMRELGSFAAFKREIPQDLVVTSNDPDHVDTVIRRATDEKSLKGGSLLASGGWHAPSEVLYNEFLELESRDGILGLPEIGVARGGVQITPGPSFAAIFQAITGFHVTEAQDIDGDYAPGSGGNVQGPKPVYKVEPPAFQDYRLAVDGVIIQSGLLASRGYPEHLARVIRGALVAHDHRINANVISDMAAGSTPVTLPAGQLGAAAPVLSAIELQVEHMKTVNRMARGTTVEAVFPYWVRGAIRSDLSRRLGVDLISVPDARIIGWFTDRGIAPQFVYDWQSIDTTAIGSFTQWPTSVSFLLYAAGTWVKGVSDILTLDTLYDSTLLGQNDFTALFTEEGWFAALAGVDSRLVTTSISATGVTHIGDEIANSGAAS